MSSAAVRSAVASFFETASITGLNFVHPGPPWWITGSEWDLGKTAGAAAVAAVHLVEDNESRITIPALSGQKQVEYLIGLMLFYQYLQPSNSLTPKDPSAWVAPFDVIIDGVKDRLRSDPNCGMPSVVWQSAQDPHDISVKRDLPRVTAGKVLAWCAVEFHVTEIVTA